MKVDLTLLEANIANVEVVLVNDVAVDLLVVADHIRWGQGQ